MKDNKYIDQLLEKYFEGATSLHEENSLRQYFAQNTIAERHSEYKELFNFFTLERKKKKSDSNVRRLILRTAVAASLVLVAGVLFEFITTEDTENKSLVYIDGKYINDNDILNRQAMISIRNISSGNENIVDTQVGILEIFTE